MYVCVCVFIPIYKKETLTVFINDKSAIRCQRLEQFSSTYGKYIRGVSIFICRGLGCI